MTDPFAALLTAAEDLVLLDGGLASELEHRGADLSDPLWSARLLLDQPLLLAEVHRDYLLVGADVVTTGTYQATLEGLARRGVTGRQAEGLFRLATTLARDAADEVAVLRERAGRPPALVAASAGPYGASLADGSEYRGDDGRSVRYLLEFHRPRLELLLAGRPDLIAFETIPSAREGEAIVRLLEEFPDARAWVSFSCRDGERLSDGTLFSDAMDVVSSASGVVASGLNCTHPAWVESLLRGAAAVPGRRLACPNAGDRWDPDARVWVGEADVDLAAMLPAWVDAGARVVGGCCRTTPATIAAMGETCGRRPLLEAS